MALNDLMSKMSKPHFVLDQITESLIVEQVLTLINDTNTEVKNNAVKIGTLVKLVSEKRLFRIVEQLILLSSSPKDEQLRDIANLGLRTVVREISANSPGLATTITNKLTPSLLGQLENKNATPDALQNTVELLNDVLTRFEPVIRTLPDVQNRAMTVLVSLLSNNRPAIRKRSIDALALLMAATPADSALLKSLLSTVVYPALAGKGAGKGAVDNLTAISLVGAIALRAPSKLGPRLDENDLVMLIADAAAATSTSQDATSAMDQDDAESDSDQDVDNAQAELREAVLQTLERLLLKCPKSMTPFVQTVLKVSTTLISWDPNFAGGDDEDMDVDDKDEEDDMDDDYSDDEDASWKVRRASARTICAAIETCHDLLPYFCQHVSPILIDRFSEREESVRMEVWSTFGKLIETVSLMSGLSAQQRSSSVSNASLPRAAREDTPNTLKRKRGTDNGMDISATPTPTSMAGEDIPLAMLKSQVPLIVKALIRQMSQNQKTFVSVSQAAFTLLNSLVVTVSQTTGTSVPPGLGGLEEHVPTLIRKAQNALSLSGASSIMNSSSGTTTTLKIVVLQFLSHLFATTSQVSDEAAARLVQSLVACTSDKFNKIASSAFSTISALLKSQRMAAVQAQDIIAPLSPTQIALDTELYNAVAHRLETTGADQEVRESAVYCLGDILFYSGDALSSSDRTRALALIKDALKREVTRLCAVNTAGKVATSPVIRQASCSAEYGAWINANLADIVLFLKQNNRLLKANTFAALPRLVLFVGETTGLEPSNLSKVLEGIAPFISVDDLPLLPPALNTIRALLLADAKATLASPSFRNTVFPQLLALLSAAGFSAGPAMDATLSLFNTLPQSASDAKNVIASVKTVPTRIAAKCIGAVVMAQPEVATEVADEFVKMASNDKNSSATVAFALLTLGEVGRAPTYTDSQKAVTVALTHFSSSVDDTKSAAAFALGNLAVGSPTLVSQIIEQIAASNADDKQRSLGLQALKEFIIHAKPATLAEFADSLWTPLFSICAIDGPPPAVPGLPADAKPDAKKARDKKVEQLFKEGEPAREHWKQTESSRNIASECLGKITLTEPHRFIPQLQARLQDSQAGIRAAVISAVKYTLTVESPAYDAVLSSTHASFLSLMRDPNLDVRRTALTAFNFAAHQKPELVKQQLAGLLPLLYAETLPSPDYIRIIEMGPFKLKVDDALEVRKAAYETCYTLLDTCFAKLDMNELLDAVLRGIKDDNEIRAICYLMLIRLCQLAPTSVTQKLDQAADTFNATFDEKLKDNAVKQEQEKHAQMQRAALRAVVALSRLSSSVTTPKFEAMVQKVRNNPQLQSQFKELSEVDRTLARTGGMDLDD